MEKYYSFQNNDINTKISIVLSKIVDEKIYSYIMKELFTYEIGKQLKFINNLNILPKLNETQLQQNFKNNIRKIISKIKYFIQNPNSDVYKVLSCIYGAFLGDAIGAFCEFKEPNKNNSRDIFKLTSTVIGGDFIMGHGLIPNLLIMEKLQKMLLNYSILLILIQTFIIFIK